MTILDEHGIKRLLCRDRPTELAISVRFSFPENAKAREVCVNGGEWTQIPWEGDYEVRATELLAGEILTVRFRARDEGGRTLYSRSYALTGERRREGDARPAAEEESMIKREQAARLRIVKFCHNCYNMDR